MRHLIALFGLLATATPCTGTVATQPACESACSPSESASTDAERLVIEITSTQGAGPGSVRAAIDAANGAGRSTRIVSRLDAGSEVTLVDALPALTAADTIFDANGLVLRGGACTRPDGRKGCDGLLIRGPKIRVNKLVAHDFTFDGIAVRGPAAVDVHVSDCHSYDNKDDGVGISAGAREVVVERCRLERNGFRTKGKGILVFDYAEAELRDNVVRGNRDGVTISRRAKANLVGNEIVGNYDKGFGVAGATATGERNTIAANGTGMPGMDRPPNGDGVRVTLDSSVRLVETVIADNGDSGVVVIGTAKFAMSGGRVSGNAGVGLRAAEMGSIALEGVELRDNRKGPHSIIDKARLDTGPRIDR